MKMVTPNLGLLFAFISLINTALAAMTFNINGGGSLLINAEDYKTFELINAPSLCSK
jgi:hypothetical protein